VGAPGDATAGAGVEQGDSDALAGVVLERGEALLDGCLSGR
jgi:hypothetical protein